MLYHIDITKMLQGAKESLRNCKRSLNISLDLLIFLLVSTIATIPQSVFTVFYIFFVMFTDPGFYELVTSGPLSDAEIYQYTNGLMANIPSWFYVVLLFSSGFMILASLLYCKLFEKRKAYTLGYTAKGCVTEYLMGAVIGLVMISLPVLVCKLTGCITITVSKDFSPVMVLLFFIAFLFQGMGEEVLFRGYLMTSLARKTNIWIAIIGNSLMFSFFHIGNASFSFIAFLNIFLFGVFASVFMLKRGSIWAVGAIHSLWNFGQGNIFGFNVSGNPKFDTLFESTQQNFGKILHGGDFGPEGGLGVTVILLVALLVALLLPTKRSEKVEMSEESPTEETV